MNKQDPIVLARQAGNDDLFDPMQVKFLERFYDIATAAAVEQERKEFAVHAIDIARKAIEEEREACAKVADELEKQRCEAWHQVLTKGGEIPSATLSACAAAIRARGEMK